MRPVLSLTGRLRCLPVRSRAMSAGASSILRVSRCGLALAALVVLGTTTETAGATPPAACEEYVVCGQPAAGPSSGSDAPVNPANPRPSQPGPRPSVVSRTDLPLTGYPLTPVLLVLCGALAVGLVARVLIGVGRRGATS